MATLWMTLYEAFEFAQGADGGCTKERLQQLLQRGEIEAKARFLRRVEVRAQTRRGVTLVRSRIPKPTVRYLARLAPRFWTRAALDLAASSAVAKHWWGLAEAREILLRREDVERLWPTSIRAREAPEQPVQAKAVDLVQPEATKKTAGRKRGRKPTWDWDGALLEMARLAPSAEKRPDKQSTMEGMVRDWFMSQKGDHPAPSSIAEHVKQFYDRNWSAS